MSQSPQQHSWNQIVISSCYAQVNISASHSGSTQLCSSLNILGYLWTMKQLHIWADISAKSRWIAFLFLLSAAKYSWFLYNAVLCNDSLNLELDVDTYDTFTYKQVLFTIIVLICWPTSRRGEFQDTFGNSGLRSPNQLPNAGQDTQVWFFSCCHKLL